MNLPTLTDAELLQHGFMSTNGLTSTPLELELLRRFEDNAAITAENEPLLEVLADFGEDYPLALREKLEVLADLDLKDVAKVLGAVEGLDAQTVEDLHKVLADSFMDDHRTLRRDLELAERLRNACNDDVELLRLGAEIRESLSTTN